MISMFRFSPRGQLDPVGNTALLDSVELMGIGFVDLIHEWQKCVDAVDEDKHKQHLANSKHPQPVQTAGPGCLYCVNLISRGSARNHCSDGTCRPGSVGEYAPGNLVNSDGVPPPGPTMLMKAQLT